MSTVKETNELNREQTLDALEWCREKIRVIERTLRDEATLPLYEGTEQEFTTHGEAYEVGDYNGSVKLARKLFRELFACKCWD